jgi:hypothetical protein
MAYDEKLAERIQQLLEDEPPMSQQKMFGGRLKEHQLSAKTMATWGSR